MRNYHIVVQYEPSSSSLQHGLVLALICRNEFKASKRLEALQVTGTRSHIPLAARMMSDYGWGRRSLFNQMYITQWFARIAGVYDTK